jgi:hypothetical protein
LHFAQALREQGFGKIISIDAFDWDVDAGNGEQNRQEVANLLNYFTTIDIIRIQHSLLHIKVIENNLLFSKIAVLSQELVKAKRAWSSGITILLKL